MPIKKKHIQRLELIDESLQKMKPIRSKEEIFAITLAPTLLTELISTTY